jgi:predicted ribosome quality control (RQC) complex YloA/Tae2 family protein
MIHKNVIDNKTNIEYQIIIGRNAQENWNIIDTSDDNDIWFHLEDNPSPHVILKTNNINKNKISKNVIKLCSCLCKQYSKFNNMNNISIIYTEIKNIVKGKEVGSVITNNIKKIKI